MKIMKKTQDGLHVTNKGIGIVLGLIVFATLVFQSGEKLNSIETSVSSNTSAIIENQEFIKSIPDTYVKQSLFESAMERILIGFNTHVDNANEDYARKTDLEYIKENEDRLEGLIDEWVKKN